MGLTYLKDEDDPSGEAEPGMYAYEVSWVVDAAFEFDDDAHPYCRQDHSEGLTEKVDALADLTGEGWCPEWYRPYMDDKKHVLNQQRQQRTKRGYLR